MCMCGGLFVLVWSPVTPIPAVSESVDMSQIKRGKKCIKKYKHQNEADILAMIDNK